MKAVVYSVLFGGAATGGFMMDGIRGALLGMLLVLIVYLARLITHPPTPKSVPRRAEYTGWYGSERNVFVDTQF